MAVDMGAAQQVYGVSANLINAIPELRDLLAEAVTGGWSQDKLNAKVAEQPWYQAHGLDLRNLLMQQITDPATFNENLANAQRLVRQTAAGMGRTVDVSNLAYRYLAEGWTADTLKQTVGAGSLQTQEAGAFVGDAAQIQAHLEQTAQSYGVAYTKDYINSYVNRIQTARDTVDGFDAVMRARAKAAFPQFADQLDAGQTLTQIADPYMATYAQTLQVPQSAVKLSDPLIKRALSTPDPKTGAMTSQPLWQFEQTLKKDPRYGYTDQAKSDAYSTLSQIGKDWGFTGGGSVG